MDTDKLDVRELAGLVMMVGITADWRPDRPEALAELSPGAVILYGRNVVSREQVRDLTKQLRNVPSPIPPRIAIDHEGGRVNRLRGITGVTAFESNQAVARRRDARAFVAAEARTVAAELAALGFQINLAPVCDVVTNPLNTDIAERSYAADPEVVTELAGAYIREAKAAGLITCAKHFPGYGSIAVNPHDAPARGEADAAEWRAVHWPPFQAAVDAGVSCVMTGHVIYDWLDDGHLPASLSSTIARMVREDLAFDGVIVTDDLEMGAITAGYDVGDAAVTALAAGADLVLVCHTPERQVAVHRAIVAAVDEGRLPEARLRDAARRVLSLPGRA